jgi:hypothetical protein
VVRPQIDVNGMPSGSRGRTLADEQDRLARLEGHDLTLDPSLVALLHRRGCGLDLLLEGESEEQDHPPSVAYHQQVDGVPSLASETVRVDAGGGPLGQGRGRTWSLAFWTASF